MLYFNVGLKGSIFKDRSDRRSDEIRSSGNVTSADSERRSSSVRVYCIQNTDREAHIQSTQSSPCVK